LKTDVTGIPKDPSGGRTTERFRVPDRTARSLLVVGSVAFAIAIFVVDTITDNSVAVAVLYVANVLVAATVLQKRGVVRTAVACTALTVLSIFLAPIARLTVIGLSNTLISIAAIGLTSLLVVRSKESVSKVREQASLLDLTHDAIFSRGLDGTLRTWNRGAEELYGWSAREAIGQVSHQLLKTVFPEPREAIDQQVLSTGRWEGELQHTRKDGSVLRVDSRWSLERDDAGQPIGHLETNNDISERKRVEAERDRLRRLEAELAHVSRVTMLGELSASLAHELNQPITAIVSSANACARWLARVPPELDEARELASKIARDGTRAGELIQRLRALYKKDTELRRDPVDLNVLASEIAALLRSEATRRSVSLRTDLAPSLPELRADRVQLQQVLLNLMLNGIEAMNPSGGVLLVRSGLREDGQVCVAVSDTGVGLSGEAAERLFEPFFTTKAQGTGMGLAISRSIIESHRGRLWAVPNEPRGATFQFTLPVEPAPVGSAPT